MMSSMAVPTVVTAGPGASPIGGDDQCRSRSGFRYGGKWSREEEIRSCRSCWSFYRASKRAASRRRARGDRQQRGERVHAVVLSSMRAGEDEDDPSLDDISPNVMVGWARPWFGLLVG
jgi:hypothetical protein